MRKHQQPKHNCIHTNNKLTMTIPWRTHLLFPSSHTPLTHILLCHPLTHFLIHPFTPPLTPRAATLSLDPPGTGRKKGFAWVDFVDVDSAERACRELNGMMVLGRPLKVRVGSHRNLSLP